MTDDFLQPFRHRRIGEGHLGVGSGREAVLPAVRDIPVAVPASLALAFFCHFEIHLSQLHHFGGELGVTSDAVIHDNLSTGILCRRNLRFAE